MSSQAFDRTSFQGRCEEACQTWGTRNGLVLRFEEVQGKDEMFLVARVREAGLHGDVFIYEDEAGLMRDVDDWRLCERADYETDDGLITAFMAVLDTWAELREP